MTLTNETGVDADLDAYIEEQARRRIGCRTCKQIQDDPLVGEYVSKGRERGMSMRDIVGVVKLRRGVEVSLDSLRNHVANAH